VTKTKKTALRIWSTWHSGLFLKTLSLFDRRKGKKNYKKYSFWKIDLNALHLCCIGIKMHDRHEVQITWSLSQLAIHLCVISKSDNWQRLPVI